MNHPSASSASSNDITQPLLARDGCVDTPASAVDLQDVALASATLTLILLGLGLVFTTALLPTLVVWIVKPNLPLIHLFITVTLLQVVHLRLLWVSTIYLAVYRWLWLPIRRLLLPVVMCIVRIESIREKTPTLYFETNSIEITSPISSESDASTAILQSFRRSVRRRYKDMRKLFVASRIQHQAVHCERALHLSQVVPIMWKHETRQCEIDGKNVYNEFLKRFLVVTVVPDAILDLYYSQSDEADQCNELVAVQLSIQQGSVLHWFMYFCEPNYSKSGIWFHGILAAQTRGVLLVDTVDQVNAQVHQTASKKNAGLVSCEHTDADLLSKLYPRSFTRRIPDATMEIELWKRP